MAEDLSADFGLYQQLSVSLINGHQGVDLRALWSSKLRLDLTELFNIKEVGSIIFTNANLGQDRISVRQSHLEHVF